jgi:plastocyanin
MGSKTVAWSILIMGISLAAVVILWAWIGYIGPTYSREILITQQKILRQHYGLPPRPAITDPTLLLTPPSLRYIKSNTANTTTASAGGKDVSIVPGAATLAGKAFSPNITIVKVGGSVTWTDKDTTASHTVTSGTGYNDANKGKEFDSGLSTLLTFGKTFSHTFDTAGEIPYFCQIHPTMVGKVDVS